MKCRSVNKLRYLLLTLLMSTLIFSKDAISGDKIEHTEHIHYDMKTGEENVYVLDISESRDHIDALVAEVSPTLKSYSEFHFSPCLEKQTNKSVSGTYHMESSRVEESDGRLSQIENFLKLEDLGVQLIELNKGKDLLFMKQNGTLMTINAHASLDQLANCTPPAKSGQ